MISTPFVAVPPPQYGGTELVVWNLVEGLKEVGHDVTLFAAGDSRTSVRTETLYTEPVWPPDPYHELAHTAWALGRILASEKAYDVVHAHVPTAPALARFSYAPLIYTLHHDRSERLQSYYCHCPAVYAVAISHRQREILHECERTTVIHHGLDTRLYPAGAGGAGVVFLGRLSREKGPAVAIDVARLAGVPIRVAGNAHWPDGEYFRGEVEPRLKQAHVEYLGEVGHEGKCVLLGSACATLCPVDWEEPFGLVLVESMLCGTPVVAFGRGSVPELIDEGVTGFVASDAEEMARIVRDRIPSLDRAACRARATERFSRERMVREYLQLYEAARHASMPELGRNITLDVDRAPTRH